MNSCRVLLFDIGDYVSLSPFKLRLYYRWWLSNGRITVMRTDWCKNFHIGYVGSISYTSHQFIEAKTGIKTVFPDV